MSHQLMPIDLIILPYLITLPFDPNLTLINYLSVTLILLPSADPNLSNLTYHYLYPSLTPNEQGFTVTRVIPSEPSLSLARGNDTGPNPTGLTSSLRRDAIPPPTPDAERLPEPFPLVLDHEQKSGTAGSEQKSGSSFSTPT